MSEITACPECDTVDIQHRTPRGGDPPTRWRCANGHEFDRPATRPAESQRRPTNGLAAKLADIGEANNP